MSPTDYVGLHERYARWLGDTSQTLSLGKAEDDMRERLSPLFYGMMKAVYKSNGAELAIDILSTPQIREFMTAHAVTLDSSFEKLDMSAAMRRRLQRSNFIFSGMKSFHEVNEALSLLYDNNGVIKPVEQFLNDARNIDEIYNRNWLRSEYNFVASSARMASKWERFMADGDRYNLQYRTQKDDKVRPEHAALDGVTLPPSDSFWEEFYPPNGWNCRCTVVQVRKSKYPATSHDEAIRLGDDALQRDTKGIFRFNPGLENKSVPDYNPYTIRRCRDCDIAKGKLKLARSFVPDNEVCAACAIVHQCFNDKEKSETAIRRKHYLHLMEPLLNKKVIINGNGHDMPVGFSKYGNKHLYSDTYGRSSILNADDLANMDELLANAKFIRKSSKSKPRKDKIERFYYYEAEIRGKKIYLNVAETDFKTKHGNIWHERFLYSVTDTLK